MRRTSMPMFFKPVARSHTSRTSCARTCSSLFAGQYQSGCCARTAYNRANIVVQFLKLHWMKGLLHKCDWPEYVDAIRKIYEADEEIDVIDSSTGDWARQFVEYRQALRQEWTDDPGDRAARNVRGHIFEQNERHVPQIEHQLLAKRLKVEQCWNCSISSVCIGPPRVNNIGR